MLQYVVGKTLGHRRIAPRVSPNKTWKGFVGGGAAATPSSRGALHHKVTFAVVLTYERTPRSSKHTDDGQQMALRAHLEFHPQGRLPQQSGQLPLAQNETREYEG